MARYEVLIAQRVASFLEKLDSFEKQRILKRIEELAENPFTVGEPRGKFWILKVGRAGYRLAFTVEGTRIMVASIEQRKSSRYRHFYD